MSKLPDELTLSFHMEKAMKEYIEKKNPSLSDTIKIGSTNFAKAVADEAGSRIKHIISRRSILEHEVDEIVEQLKKEIAP